MSENIALDGKRVGKMIDDLNDKLVYLERANEQLRKDLDDYHSRNGSLVERNSQLKEQNDFLIKQNRDLATKRNASLDEDELREQMREALLGDLCKMKAEELKDFVITTVEAALYGDCDSIRNAILE